MASIVFLTGSGQNAFTSAERTGNWEKQFAFASLEPTAVIYRAPHMQLANAYVRPNTTYNANIENVLCYFCDDVDFRDVRGGVNEWSREMASVPANHNFYESFSYAFPGYFMGRAPFTQAPTSKLVREFFVVGGNSNYTTPGDIPQYAAQNYAWAYTLSASSGYIPEAFDGYLANTNVSINVYASVPNLNTYQAWVASDAASNTSYSIEVADSVLEQYRGPIWMRTRRFVKAR